MRSLEFPAGRSPGQSGRSLEAARSPVTRQFLRSAFPGGSGLFVSFGLAPERGGEMKILPKIDSVEAQLGKRLNPRGLFVSIVGE